jgi:hypothetical protein
MQLAARSLPLKNRFIGGMHRAGLACIVEGGARGEVGRRGLGIDRWSRASTARLGFWLHQVDRPAAERFGQTRDGLPAFPLRAHVPHVRGRRTPPPLGNSEPATAMYDDAEAWQVRRERTQDAIGEVAIEARNRAG